jgi:hypothetical protein
MQNKKNIKPIEAYGKTIASTQIQAGRFAPVMKTGGMPTIKELATPLVRPFNFVKN